MTTARGGRAFQKGGKKTPTRKEGQSFRAQVSLAHPRNPPGRGETCQRKKKKKGRKTRTKKQRGINVPHNTRRRRGDVSIRLASGRASRPNKKAGSPKERHPARPAEKEVLRGEKQPPPRGVCGFFVPAAKRVRRGGGQSNFREKWEKKGVHSPRSVLQGKRRIGERERKALREKKKRNGCWDPTNPGKCRPSKRGGERKNKKRVGPIEKKEKERNPGDRISLKP